MASRRPPATSANQPIHRNPERISKLGGSSESGVRPLTRLEKRDVAPREPRSASKIMLREPRILPGGLESRGEVSHTDYTGSRKNPRSQAQDSGGLSETAIAVTIHGELTDLHGMQPLAERLEWVVRHYDPKGHSARKLSTAALKNPTHLGLLIKRLRKGGSAEWQTLKKIAQRANVSLHWLMTGDGPRTPYEPYVTTTDPFPNRQVAVESAIRFGLPGEAIQRVFERDWGDTHDPAPYLWFRRIQLAVEELGGGY